MKITILVHNPDFAASQDLQAAFSLWGQSELVSFQRGRAEAARPAGHLIDDERETCIGLVADCDMLVFGDVSSFTTLYALFDDHVSRRCILNGIKRKVCFAGDTGYMKEPRKHNALFDDYGITAFVMPNLIHRARDNAIPFHYPVPDVLLPKRERIFITSSPQQPNRGNVKNTGKIENTLRRVMQDTSWQCDYQRIMDMAQGEAVEIRAQSHIFIDQMTGWGDDAGPGRSAMEGLMSACCVISDTYPPERVNKFFEPAPIVPISNEENLYLALRELREHPERIAEIGTASRNWALAHVSYAAFLSYVERFIK